MAQSNQAEREDGSPPRHCGRHGECPLLRFARPKPPVRSRPTPDVWARLSKVRLQASDFDHYRNVTPTCCTAPSRRYSQVHILTILEESSIFVLNSTMPL